jgi:hypothetical protein
MPAINPDIPSNIKIPEIPELPYAGIDLKVQGIDLASLARSLYQWADPPDELIGSVVEGNNSFSTLVEWRHAGGKATAESRFAANGHASLDEAGLATACNVLYLLILNQDKMFQNKLSRTEFEIFARSLRHYSAYRAIVSEMRSKAEEKARAELEEADCLAKGLIARNTGDRFSSVYMLATFVAIAKPDIDRARDYLTYYKIYNPNDKRVEDLQKRLDAYPMKQKHRPVQPGVSAGSMQYGGTLCCLVRDKTDPTKRYLLGDDQVFGGKLGVGITQPSPIDGGAVPADQIGQVVKRVDLKPNGENLATGALVAISDGIEVDPKCYKFGTFAGLGEVAECEKITMVGRTSGEAQGKVVNIKAAIELTLGFGPLDERHKFKFVRLIECQGADGGRLIQPGDSGAPVVNDRKELVGMAFAGSEDTSYVLPIKPILDALSVDLVIK